MAEQTTFNLDGVDLCDECGRPPGYLAGPTADLPVGSCCGRPIHGACYQGARPWLRRRSRKPEGSVIVETARIVWRAVHRCLFDSRFAADHWAPEQARQVCAQYFRFWLAGHSEGYVHGQDERRQWILDHVHELRGKTLLCWCPQPGPCHGHVLADLANTTAEELDR